MLEVSLNRVQLSIVQSTHLICPASEASVATPSSGGGSTSGASSSSSGGGVAANIKVAVRVRPENRREIAGNYANVVSFVKYLMLLFSAEKMILIIGL